MHQLFFLWHACMKLKVSSFLISLFLMFPFSNSAHAVNWDSGFDRGKNPANQISVDCTNFSNNLSCADTNVQHALETLDQVTGGGGGTGSPGGTGSNVQYRINGTTFGGVSNSGVVGNNIGIGSTIPTQALDVVGTVKATEFDFRTTAGVIQGLNSSGGAVTINTGNSSTISGDFTVTTPAGSGGIAGSEYFLPGAGGSNVGGSIVGKAGDAGAAGNQAPGVVKWDGGNDLGMGILPDGPVLLQTVTTGGNVGIGSTIPTQKLDVNGTIRMVGFSLPTGASSGYVLTSNGVGIGTWSPSTGGGGGSPGGSGTEIQFRGGASTFSAVTGSGSVNGNIGIGSTIPTQKLDVVGTIKASQISVAGTTSTGATGSGNLVFGTSPTLVTPALGTPSSGVATNLTGLPLTTGVTGILPIANGGTNASTALAASSNLSYHPFGTSNGETGPNNFIPAFIGQIGEDDYNTGPFWYFGKRTNGYTFTVATITTKPAVNDTYTNNGVTFTVKEVGSLTGTSGSILGFINCTASGDPAASGNLTRTSGAGDATIAFSAFTRIFNWADANNANNFPTGINSVGDPNYPYLNSDITRTTFYVDVSPALRLNGGASGDSGLEVASFNPNSFNSGTSLFLAVMGLDGSNLPVIIDNVGASVAVVPQNKGRFLIPGTMELVVNASATDMRAVTVSSPGISGFDTGNYSIQYNDVINDMFRVPWQQPGVYQPRDVNYSTTVSGITTDPTGGTRYTNNGHKFDIVKVTLTGSVGSRTGTITMTGQEGAPTSSGTLTKSTDINDKSGTGDATIAFSAVSATTNTWKDAFAVNNHTGQTQIIGSLTGPTYDGSIISYITSGLSSITVTNQGTGACSGTPTVSFTGGTVITQGTATATVVGGFVTSIAVNTAGVGYTTQPTVTVSGSSCSGVTATAIIGATPVLETSSLNQAERLILGNKAVITGSRTAFSAGPETIELVGNGTGININSSFQMELGVGAVANLLFDSGNLIRFQNANTSWQQDNTYDLGSSTGRPRDLYVGRNVGIGTATPGVSLDVNGTTRMTGFNLSTGSSLSGKVLTADAAGTGTWQTPSGGSVTVNSGSVNRAARYSGTTTIDSSTLITDNATNVGIGSTTPASKLDVSGTVNATAFNGLHLTTSTGTLTIANGKTSTINNTLTFAGTDSTTQTFQGTDTIVGRATTDTLTNKTFDTAGTGNQFFINGTAIGAVSGTGAVCLASGSACAGGGSPGGSGTELQFRGGASTFSAVTGSGSVNGNVGIGSITPGQKLDVNGTVRINSGLSVTVPSLMLDVNGTVGFGEPAANNLVAITNSLERMRIDSSGNVGIGTTVQSQKLTINGNLAIAGTGDSIAYPGGFFLQSNSGNLLMDGWNSIRVASIRGTNYNIADTSGTPGMRIDTTNNRVGIATTSPSSRLSILGGVSVGTVTYAVNNAAPTNGMIVEGNVGIGTFSPAYALDVSGSVRFTGHGISTGTVPTVANNDCGTTVQGTVTAGSTDLKGSFTVGTLAVTSCAITFANTYQIAPTCFTQDDTNILGVKTTTTTTKMTMTSTTSSSGDVVSYFCWQ